MWTSLRSGIDGSISIFSLVWAISLAGVSTSMSIVGVALDSGTVVVLVSLTLQRFSKAMVAVMSVSIASLALLSIDMRSVGLVYMMGWMWLVSAGESECLCEMRVVLMCMCVICEGCNNRAAGGNSFYCILPAVKHIRKMGCPHIHLNEYLVLPILLLASPLPPSEVRGQLGPGPLASSTAHATIEKS
jgi:hypothetical protein